MKKFIRVCMLLAALSAMLCVSALAADATITNKVAANSNSSSVVTEGNAAGKFNVSYDRAAKGGEHLILMVAADLDAVEKDVTTGYTITDTSILYINQATASAAGQVDFEVYPSAVKDSVILLTGAAAQPIVLATIDVAGVKISGTAVSWDDSDNTIYRLYDATTDNEDIKADMKLATSALALNYAASAGDVEANVDGEHYDQSFSFSGVPNGSYKLAIQKEGKYVPTIIEIDATAGDVDLGDVRLWLYGDVTYDVYVDAFDALQILQYDVFMSSIFDTGDARFQAERLVAADVTSDDAVDAFDALQILQYDVFMNSIFDTFV